MNKQLNTYLRDVETRLRSLPSVDREQEIAEIAQHLETLIAARIGEGQTENDATAEAIAQFGAARDIGSRLYQTDEHKRWVPLVEIGLFCAAATTAPLLFSLLWQAILRTVQTVSPESIAQAVDRFVTPWPLQSGPIGASIGIAAFGLLVLRYGWRGVVQKACDQTPTGAAVRWVFLSSFIGIARHVLMHGLYGGVSHSASLSQQIVMNVSTNALSLSITFTTAYLVGRVSQSRESVADAIGCAVGVGILTGLLEMLFQSVPLPWHHFATPLPLPENLTFYLTGLLATPVWGAVSIYAARFGVQRGEKSRRQSSHHARQIA